MAENKNHYASSQPDFDYNQGLNGLYYPDVDVYKENQNENTVEQEFLKQKRIRMNPYTFIVTHQEFIDKVRRIISNQYSKEIIAINEDDRRKIEMELSKTVQQMLLEEQLLPSDNQIAVYVHQIFSEILGLGSVIEDLLSDETVDEIIIQDYDTVQVERFGRLEDTPYRFATRENLIAKIQKIVRPLNMEFDTLHPNIDAQLPDGSRISASKAPFRANDAVSLDIRKFAPIVHPLEWYVEQYQSQAPEMVEFEKMCTRAALNILVSGGTGSGKTTFLNSLSISIPDDARIITVEDTLELKLQQPRIESYQKVEPNMEGKGGISMQDAVIHALRKRPDRIIIGEVRGAEIVEMINAMNTGHDGSLSTIHANNPRDCITRATIMILSNPDTSHLEEGAILQMISSAVNLIIQTARLEDGSRKVMNISEIVGYGEAGFTRLKEKGILSENETVDRNHLYIQDIFSFEQTSQETVYDEEGHRKIELHGRFVTTGYVPDCLEHLQSHGEKIDKDFFKKRVLMEV